MPRSAPSGVAAYRHGRVPREVRLRQVLELAAELFAERGYSAASMDELARRAGVSKPVVYDLVGSKEELFGTLMTRAAEELTTRVERAVRAADAREERLHAGAVAWFRFVAGHRATWVAFLAGDDVPSRAVLAAVRRRQAAFVAGLLTEDAAALGAAVPPALLDAAAHLVNGAFESLAAWWGDHQAVTAEQLADVCTRVLLPGLAALAGDAPASWEDR